MLRRWVGCYCSSDGTVAGVPTACSRGVQISVLLAIIANNYQVSAERKSEKAPPSLSGKAWHSGVVNDFEMLNPVGQPHPMEHKADHIISRAVPPVAAVAPAPVKEIAMTTPSASIAPAPAPYPASRPSRGSFATVISTAADGRPKVTTVGNWA